MPARRAQEPLPRVRSAAKPAAPAPSRTPAAPPSRPRPGSPLALHAEQLRARWGEHGFTVLVEQPFVVLGDEAPEQVARYSESTVRWATQRLRAQYFAADPKEIIDVWLLGSEASYEQMSIELCGEAPSTPYGYYSREHAALVMNIGTGGGTLVHEIVHPYMSTNFPACPSWFDEGLASLYEQSSEHEGMIWGLTNWRLPSLQEAIRARSVPSTRALTESGDRPFYDEDPGTNYAHARYLCMWLQEHALLGDFYRAFVANAARDPSGFTTLRELVGADDMRAWDRAWQRWVLTLRFA
jgi:hypothetical protein